MREIVDRAMRAGACQKEAELQWLLERVAEEWPGREPVIVEIGCDAGGTLFAWRHAFPRADVIGVTLQSGPFSTGEPLRSWGAVVIAGDSHDDATYSRLLAVLEPLGGYADLLFIDGDHTYRGVSLDFAMYGPLVRPGGLVALHDVVVHPNAPDCQVWRLWAELDGEKRQFVAVPTSWGGIGLWRRPLDFAGLGSTLEPVARRRRGYMENEPGPTWRLLR